MSGVGPRRELEILEIALALGREQRGEYLASECGDDVELKSRLEQRLLESEESGVLPKDFPVPATDPAGSSGAGSASPPRQIGPYRIFEQIGEGGMGTVYVAEQVEPVRRRVAVKVIKPGMESKAVLARFESERQALALMNHPSIARILDVGTTEQSRPYFVMEYVPGLPITKYCDGKRLGVEERLALFLDLCSAIDHAHQRGIIHRDIKPSNVLVTEEGGGAVVKVIDFGIAKATNQRLSDLTVHTRLGSLIGTPEYMSPEQAELTRLDVDTRTDVYSLGAVLYELLVGVPPLSFADEDSLITIQKKIGEDDPPSPSTRLTREAVGSVEAVLKRSTDSDGLRRALRGDLDWITMKALEKDRNRRYSFASELAADVRRHLEHRPVLAGPPSVTYRLGKFARRHRGAVVAGALAAGLLLVGLWGVWGWTRIARTTELAQRFGQDVASLEWQLRVAQMSPLHEMTRDRRRIEMRLDEIASQSDRLGNVARAAGEYAVGRGMLALGRDDEALDHLEAAWQADLHGPEVAFARGVALGRIFRRESTRARAISDPQRRDELLAESERRYRDPALEALAEARSTASAPLPYVEALIAFYDGRYDDTFRLVDAALAEAPWLWEAYQLEGDARSHVGVQHFRENRREQGHAAMLEADQAYARAIALAPSAGEAYFGRCTNGVYRLFQTLNEAVTDEEYGRLRGEVERSCGNLQAVLPEHPELPVNLANMHLMTGRRLVAQGKDPRGEYERGRALAESALERRAESASALRALGDAILGLGRYGWERGDDTRPLLAQAGAVFERAAQLELSTAAFNNAANAYLLKGRLERARGIDPSASFTRAEELYRRSSALSPTDVLTLGNLTLVTRDIAEWDGSHGRDPRPRLRESARLLDTQIERAPKSPFLQLSLAGLSAQLAEAEARWGGDEAARWLERGRRAAARAIELNPGTHGPFWNLAQIEREAAREAVLEGIDPAPAAKAAFAALDRYLELFPDQAKAYRLRGEVHLELARYAFHDGRDPSPSLRAAATALAGAVRLQPSEERRVLPSLAALRILEIETAPNETAARRRLAPAALVAGRIEELASDEGAALLAAARVRRWESKLSQDEARRVEAGREAAVLFDRALALNPALQSELQENGAADDASSANGSGSADQGASKASKPAAS